MYAFKKRWQKLSINDVSEEYLLTHFFIYFKYWMSLLFIASDQLPEPLQVWLLSLEQVSVSLQHLWHCDLGWSNNLWWRVLAQQTERHTEKKNLAKLVVSVKGAHIHSKNAFTKAAAVLTDRTKYLIQAAAGGGSTSRWRHSDTLLRLSMATLFYLSIRIK